MKGYLEGIYVCHDRWEREKKKRNEVGIRGSIDLLYKRRDECLRYRHSPSKVVNKKVNNKKREQHKKTHNNSKGAPWGTR
jgi:hypothetical protein